MPDNFNKNRILKNSLLLYVRMLFTMWINLYATRLVLQNLGVEDMGVYGVVGSIVSLFTVFTSGITSAVQRFITFELGLKNGQPNKVFCSSLNVIFILSALMLLLLEIGGQWMLYHKVNIPETSRTASFWVFQLSVLTCIVNTISIPYNALIIAHEKMDAFAIISIVQVVLNFLAAYCISLFADNRLLIYAILLASVSILIRLLYQIYCHHKFSEARYHFNIDWTTVKQIGKFTGVSTASGGLQVISSQGIVFIINLTFGVTINAVYTIALQLKNAILSFSLNILKAISPQITKTYANGEMEIHKKLVYSGSKMEIYFIYLIMIPFLFRTEYILKIWLGEVPEHLVIFAQNMAFVSLIYAAFEPIRTAVIATNRISKFMLIPEAINILTLPLCFWVGKYTHNPTFFIQMVHSCEILILIVRIYYATKVSFITVKGIINEILFPCIKVAILCAFICFCISSLVDQNFKSLLIILFVNSIFWLIIIYLVGLSANEKLQIHNIAINIWKIKKK
jgi:O-antigen/teichoic acid export membrane protein